MSKNISRREYSADLPREAHSTKPYRLMSFDGGGVHAVTYLPVIADLEAYLGSTIATSRQFHMLAGTSTGAIVATAIKLGTPASHILDMYLLNADNIFTRANVWHWPFFLYPSATLRAVLAEFYRSHTNRATDITWRQLSQSSAYPELELVVTLWDVSRERTAFLSTNLKRSNQAEELWDAALADIIAACCSAPVFFPARWFRKAGAEYAFCDGGITGLNTPATFGVSLTHNELVATGRHVHVVSFGAGEIAEPDERKSKPMLKDIRNRSIIQLAPAAIDALLTSTSRLMNQFYHAFGDTLNIVRYVRTNHVRPRDSKLDDAASVRELATHFREGKVYYDLWRSSKDSRSTAGQVSAVRQQHPTHELEKWRQMWSAEFELQSIRCTDNASSQRNETLCLPVPLSSTTPSLPVGVEAGYPRMHTALSQNSDINDQHAPPDAESDLATACIIESGEIIPTWRAILAAPMVAAVVMAFVLVCGLAVIGFFVARNAEAIAVHQKGEADKQRQIADQLRKVAVQAEEEARKLKEATRYAAEFRLAATEMDEDLPVKAAFRLSELPGDLKGWEHNHLARVCTGIRNSQAAPPSTFHCMAGTRDGELFVATNGDDGIVLLSSELAPKGEWNARREGNPVPSVGRAERMSKRQSMDSILSDMRSLVHGVAISGEARLIAVGLWNSVVLIDIANLQEKRRLLWDTERDFNLASAAAGNYLEKQLLWRFANNTLRSEENDTQLILFHGPTSICFSRSGKYLVAGGFTGKVRLWEVSTGKEIRSWTTGNASVGVAFSEDETSVVTAPWGGKVTSWSVQTGGKIREFEPSGKYYECDLSGDGKHVAAAEGSDESGGIRIWSLDSGDSIFLHADKKQVECLRFTPNGKDLVAANHDYKVIVVDVHQQRVRRTLLYADVVGAAIWPESLCVSADSNAVYTYGSNSNLIQWDISRDREVLELQSTQKLLSDVAISAGRIAASHYGGLCIAWDRSTTEASSMHNAGRSVYAITSLCDDVMLIGTGTVGSSEGSGDSQPADRKAQPSGTIELWRLGSKERAEVFETVDSPVLCVRSGKSGERFVHGDFNGNVVVWDIERHARLAEFTVGPTPVGAVALSRDGKTVAACTGRRTVCESSFVEERPYPMKTWIWNVETQERMLAIENVGKYVAFSPDGQDVAAISEEGHISQWSLSSGKKRNVYVGHRHLPTTFAFSRDGDRLASGTSGGEIVVWDTRTGLPLLWLDRRGGRVASVEWSPAGDKIVSADWNGKVRIWNGSQLDSARLFRSGDNSESIMLYLRE